MSLNQSSSTFERFIAGVATLSDEIEHTVQSQCSSYPYGDSGKLTDGLLSLRDVISNACREVEAAEATAQSRTLFRTTEITRMVEFIDGFQEDPCEQGSLWERGMSELEKLEHSAIFQGFQDLMTKFELLKNTNEVIEVSKVSEIFAETERRREEEKEHEGQRRQERLRLQEEGKRRKFNAALRCQLLERLGHGHNEEQKDIPRSHGKFTRGGD